MRIVPYESIRKRWDLLAANVGSHLATTRLLDYQTAYGNKNASFAVVNEENDGIQALCPLLITPSKKVRRNVDDPCPGMVCTFVNDAIMIAAKAEYQRLLDKHEVTSALWWSELPGLPPLNDPSREPYATAHWLSMLTSLEDHWTATRKSYRNLIRQAQNKYTIVSDLNGGLIDTFRLVHQADAGRVTRPPKTWRMMGDWIRDGHGLLIGAYDEASKEWVGFGYWFLNGRTAHYASAASLHDNTLHAIQWEAIKHFSLSREIGSYEIGWDRKDTPDSLSFFKNGFGSQTTVKCKVWRWERA